MRYKKEFKTAFIPTIPVLTGYVFLGIGFGILMKVDGFSLLLTLAMSLCIYSGALQYVGIGLLCAPFSPLQTALVSLMLSFRHIFYAIAMIDKFKNVTWQKPFLIYTLSDETFSLEYATHLNQDVCQPQVWFYMGILDYTYWAIGTLLGFFFGSIITFSTDGIDFCMTAMFMVILLDQFMKEHQKASFFRSHASLITGLVISLMSLLIFGADNFIIPAMIGIVIVLTLLRPYLDAPEAHHE